jgi:hypothetical protein
MFVKEKLSHFGTETHENCASQYDHETQLQNTSYSIVETQQNNALKLLKTKRYAEFVRKYGSHRKIFDICWNSFLCFWYFSVFCRNSQH